MGNYGSWSLGRVEEIVFEISTQEWGKSMQAKKQVQRPQHGIVYGKLEEPKDKFG